MNEMPYLEPSNDREDVFWCTNFSDDYNITAIFHKSGGLITFTSKIDYFEQEEDERKHLQYLLIEMPITANLAIKDVSIYKFCKSHYLVKQGDYVALCENNKTLTSLKKQLICCCRLYKRDCAIQNFNFAKLDELLTPVDLYY
jgi:hypothetical protein